MPPKKGKGKKGNDDDWPDEVDVPDPIKSKSKGATDEDAKPATKTTSKKMKGLRAMLELSDDEKSTSVKAPVAAIPSTKAVTKKKGKTKKNQDGWDSDQDSKNIIDLKSIEESTGKDKSITKSKSKNKKKEESDDDLSEEAEEREKNKTRSKSKKKEESEDDPSDEEAILEDVVEKVTDLAISDEEEMYNSDVEREKIEAEALAKKKAEDEARAKMSHKERKKLKKQQEYDKQMEVITKKGTGANSELSENFTISQAESSDKKIALLENAVDIKVENFSISAKGKALFTNASLLIAQGRRYGLVGPNGWVILVC